MTALKLKKTYYTPAEVGRRVGVSRQTVVKWIEQGRLEAELTPGGHHRIPPTAFTDDEPYELVPTKD